MQIYHTLTPAPAPQDSAVALGYFDGVHSGHRAVLGAAVTYAAQHGLTAAAFTFELPGNNSLKGGRILSLAQKHTRVAQLGIAQYWEPSFEEFRALSPEDFVRRVLVDCFHAKAVFCGDNFTFGAYAAGNVALLEQLCAPYGITVDIVPMAQYGGQTVSSTRIRAALEEGRLDDANAMLGASDTVITHLAKQDLLYQAIAESQGIEPTQEQLDAAAASYSGSSYGDNFVHQTALQTAVMEWLKTNAVVS